MPECEKTGTVATPLLDVETCTKAPDHCRVLLASVGSSRPHKMLKLDGLTVPTINRVRSVSDRIPLTLLGLWTAVPYGVRVIQYAVTAGQFFIYGVIHE